MLNIRDGTRVFVPWRIQGIVRNEDRLRNYSLDQLEKQNKYLLNCIAREQMLASNRLDRFVEKLNNAPRTSDIMTRGNKGTMSRIQGRKPILVLDRTMTWRHASLQPMVSLGQTAPLTKQRSSRLLPDISIPRQAMPPKKAPHLVYIRNKSVRDPH